MSFTSDLKKFETKATASNDQVVRAVVLEIGTRVVYRTPVGDPDYWKSKAPAGYVGGRARANWQYGSSLGSNNYERTDKTGNLTISSISASIPKQAGGKIHYIYNNVPYILELEHGTLSPRQAPNGMVAITVVEFDNLVSQKARKTK